VEKTLSELGGALGARPACGARELTKIHEEFIRAPLTEMGALLPETMRGEWTIVIGGATGPDEPAPDRVDWRDDLKSRLEAGESRRDAARAVAEAFGLSRKIVYTEAVSEAADGGERLGQGGRGPQPDNELQPVANEPE
jgi:16S rRNA (cytidine1402-2'-O)-methyltransferase